MPAVRSNSSGHGTGGALTCAAPSMLAAGALADAPSLVANFTFEPDESAALFSAGVASYTLMGHAHVAGGALWLTADAPGQLGSCILPALPHVGPTTTFAASFDVHIGGVCLGGGRNCGGDGVSFSFGEVADEAFGADGAGDGLRIQLLTQPIRHLVAQYGGRHLGSAAMGESLRAQAPQQLAVRYAADGLWVRYGSRVLLSGVQVPSWAPRPSWRFAFGAHTAAGAAKHDHHLLDNLRIETGVLDPDSGRVSVQVSLNGEQFSTDALIYTYTPPVQVVSLDPASGPRLGGTHVNITTESVLHGGVDFRCAFDGVVVTASMETDSIISCVTPAHPDLITASAVPMAITSNGQDFTSSTLDFVYYDAVPSIHTISPLSSPSRGGSIVSVIGAGLGHGSQPRCSFGIFGTVSGSLLGPYSMLCHTPAAKPFTAVPLEVALNAQQYTTRSLSFSFYAHAVVSALSPILGPVLGDTHVRISGLGFDGGTPGTYACRFGEVRVAATFVGAALLECASTPLSPGSHCLEVSLNGQDFTKDCKQFVSAAPIELTSVTPVSGPSDGRTLVTISGVNLDAGAHNSCRFGMPPANFIEVPATFMYANSTVACYSPSWHGSSGVQSLSVTFNGQQYALPVVFEVFHPPVLSSVTPSSGPINGVTAVVLVGISFSAGSDYRCRFGSSTVPAVAVTDSRITCTSPSHTIMGVQSLRISLNGQQFTVGVPYEYVADVHLTRSSISPSSGPSAGLTLVTVSSERALANGTDYRCRFGANFSVPASISVTTGTVACLSPNLTRGLVQFSLSLNGQQFAPSTAQFSFTGSTQIEAPVPRSGPESGGTIISFQGTDLNNGSHYVCRCEGNILPATVDALASTVRCETPPSARICDAFARCLPRTGNASCSVSLNGQQYTAGVNFLYHETARAWATSPACGPVHGGTTVAVSGVGFANGTNRQCAFGEIHVPASASFNGGSEILRCTLPATWSSSLHVGASTVPLTVTINGQQFSTEALGFTILPPPSVATIHPSLVSRLGGTLVTMHGSNLSYGCDYRCSFDSITVPCEITPSGTINARVPAYEHTNLTAAHVRTSLNGQQFTDATMIALHEPVHLQSVSIKNQTRGEV